MENQKLQTSYQEEHKELAIVFEQNIGNDSIESAQDSREFHFEEAVAIHDNFEDILIVWKLPSFVDPLREVLPDSPITIR